MNNKDQKSKDHDILLMMSDLSQMSLNEKIIGFFVDTIGQLWPDLTFLYLPAQPDNEENCFEISASGSNYGYICIEKSMIPEVDDLALLQNSLAILAVILRRNEQDALLADGKLQMQNEELSQANRELTEAKKQVEKNEERYYSLLLNLEAGVVVHAPDTSIIRSNARAAELLGLTDDQIKGKTAMDPAWKFVREDSTPLPLTDYPVIQIANSRKPVKNQIVGISQSTNKDIVWATVNGFPMLDSSGQLTEIVISFIDITDRKQTEKVLNDIIEKNPLSIQIMDKDGFTLKVNPAHEILFGAIPPPGFSIFDDLQNKGFEDYILLAKKGEVVRFPDILYNVHDNFPGFPDKPTWIRAVLFPLTIPDGTTERFIFIHEDITERRMADQKIMESQENLTRSLEMAEKSRKVLLSVLEDQHKAEEEIQKLNRELEQRVTERTSQLEAANKELEAFSYSVSHDLRAPLRHINGFAEILSREYSDQLSEGARKNLNTITGSAKRMGTLIDDLLSFSRTGRVELKKSSVLMNQAINDALAQMAPSLKDRKIDFKISQLPEVQGDYNLLRQVWVNLLDNAVKYTKHRDTAVIQIGYRDDTNNLVFFIMDNGVGFDMKYADKLFGVFQRLHSSAQFDGTGIGLANVQRIILRHGGRTWAEAETDKGAAFYFSIPKK